MPGTFFPPPRVSDPDMHLGTCVTHVPWCMPGSLTSGFLWSRRRGKRSRHSRRMRNSQLCLSGKRPMDELLLPTYNSGCNNMSVPNPTGPIGALLFTSFTLIPAWISYYIHYKVWMTLLIHSRTSTVHPLKFENGWIIVQVQVQVLYSRILGHGPIQAKCTTITHNHSDQLAATDMENFPV